MMLNDTGDKVPMEKKQLYYIVMLSMYVEIEIFK